MKKRYFAAGVLAVVIAAAGIWTYPLWHTAYLLQDLAGARSLDCQMQVTLSQKGLSKGQKRFLQSLSWILQTEESAVLDWQAVGRISEHQGYAEIYCEAWEDPVTEVYISKSGTLINIKMLYEIVQDQIVQKYPIVGYMFPKWKYGTYISLEQIEEIFEVDLKEMFQQGSSDKWIGQSIWKSVLLLNGMEKHRTEDGGWQFETVWNGYQTVLKTGREKQETNFQISGTDREQSQKITAFSFSLSSAEEEIILPKSLMTSEEIEQFQKLWKAVRDFTEGRKQVWTKEESPLS